MSLIVFDDQQMRIGWLASRFSLRGAAMGMLVADERFHAVRLADIVRYLNEAVSHRQIKLFFRDDGTLTGLVVWAWVSPDTQDAIATNNLAIPELHPSQWNDGAQLHLLNVVALFGSFRTVIRQFALSEAKGGCIAWKSRNGRVFRRSAVKVAKHG